MELRRSWFRFSPPKPVESPRTSLPDERLTAIRLRILNLVKNASSGSEIQLTTTARIGDPLFDLIPDIIRAVKPGRSAVITMTWNQIHGLTGESLWKAQFFKELASKKVGVDAEIREEAEAKAEGISKGFRIAKQR